MRILISVLAIAFAFTVGPTQAAEEWGIDHEKIERFDAKVVDILCELTGDCGAGKRQLGLIRDGKLILVAKNNDIFAGAADDLHTFCGKMITADGLMITNPKMPLFNLQFKRLAPDGEWSRADWFAKKWSKANGGKDGSQWFRSDATIKKLIAKDGVFGIPGLKPEE